MTKKHILIVDDEISILRVLKNSLKKVDPSFEVTTVTNGFDALDKLLAHPYDVVVTDFNMAEMDGLELAEAIRYAQPDARLVMITAYGNDIIKAEAKRIKVFRYLNKPLEINAFRQIVKDAIEGKVPDDPDPSNWSEEKLAELKGMVEQLRADVSARSVLLTDVDANIISQTGLTKDIAVEKLVALLSGSIVTLIEAGRTIDDVADTIHLAYREGKNEDMYALNVGPGFLLILLVNKGPYSSRLGSVWYHARQAALNISNVLSEPDSAGYGATKPHTIRQSNRVLA